MNKDIALSVDNVSKQYRLGEVGTGTLSHDINRWWHRIRGKEDPYSIVGDVNDRSSSGGSEYVWALKDINFNVENGEVIGIIGKNGAGKSTLLKVLSKVTGPTTGNIKMKGRVASLLEVGTGFHPELTGRENIYLNGAILGMTKAEVTRKLDEIVNFSGCAKYVDTPVKRYSSGMMVRLGFAVAAHLEPEILIVDEVLAVGDAEFQKKAIGKMQDISSGGGRTVLFVSHNMESVANLCSRAIVLENGKVAFNGEVNKAIEFYLRETALEVPEIDIIKDGHLLNRQKKRGDVVFQKITLLNHFGNPGLELFVGKSCSFKIKFETKRDISKLEIGVGITNGLGVRLGVFISNWNGFQESFQKGIHEVEMNLPFIYLTQGIYLASFWLRDQEGEKEIFDGISNCLEFSITESGIDGIKTYLNRYRGWHLTQQTNWKYI